MVNKSRGGERLARARWCESFACRLRGLSWRRGLAEGEGLLLVEARASRWGAAIHMAGMWFPLGIIWIDPELRVVHTCHALPWRIYWPKDAAQYTLEAGPAILGQVSLGDRLEFLNENGV